MNTSETKSDAPSTSAEFDKIYKSSFAHWAWSDKRIPNELKGLIENQKPKNSLELGCGIGNFSTYVSEQGIHATGVDFSSIAIEKANKRKADNINKPKFLVGDVTNLKMLTEQYEVAFDIGCFHCLNETGQQKYVAELFRLLKSGSTLLIWALDSSPIGIKLNPDYIAKTFEKGFNLSNTKFSRRRIIGSHWYWLTKK